MNRVHKALSQPEPPAPRLCAPAGIVAAKLHLDTEYLVLSYPLPAPNLPKTLSTAEREIATLLVRGLSSGAVAKQRGVTPRTVSNQIASIYVKLGVGSRVELVRAVCWRKPVPPEHG